MIVDRAAIGDFVNQGTGLAVRSFVLGTRAPFTFPGTA